MSGLTLDELIEALVKIKQLYPNDNPDVKIMHSLILIELNEHRLSIILEFLSTPAAGQ